MRRIINLYRTTIGKKVVMATTGIVLVLFVIGHMLGNLKIFAGPGHDGKLAKIDTYGIFLREFGHDLFGPEGFLWLVRLVLLAAVVLHAISAYQVWRVSSAARPIGYKKQESVASTYASRTMRYGGIILAAFIVYHILHFTTGTAHPDFERLTGEYAGHAAVYHNVVSGFQNPIASGFYIVAMLFLGLHLYHGIWSSLQTLGVSNPRYNGWQRALSVTVAVIVAGGNILIPVAVLAGIVH
ncbi:MAG: succinate dehydrogenase cytochrome b subunit [Candidatus Eiseniibacteriota bacterium]|jgi:succinate dehydrogenase / fumarate reductase cytochrome b subunit